MPLFEYECEACGHVTAYLESADTRSQHRCEECHSDKTRKRLSTFGIGRNGGSPRSDACTGGACPTGACPYARQ